MKKFITIIILIILVAIGIYLIVAKPWSASTGNDSESSQVDTSGLSETYRNNNHKFAVKYPSGFEVAVISEDPEAGDIIVIQDLEQGTGVQIAIYPFNEPIQALTKERILQDVPELTILEPQDVLVGSDGKGVAFFDGEGEDSFRQIWFVARGGLYQITAPRKFDDTLRAIMNTWIFE